MRIFQNSGLYRSYVPRLRRLSVGASSFSELVEVFLNDRYSAVHLLSKILDFDQSAFFTNGDDEVLQQAWAREKGIPRSATLVDILRAQIEEHHTEVFYNLDPMRYGNDFVRSLPACVKCSVAWRAAPSPGADFSAYSVVVCNFPSILKTFASKGWNAAHFSPAHDPVMNEYADNMDRPIDVLFVGGYSRHHKRRAHLLDAVAQLSSRFNIEMHLDTSRITRFAESPLGRFAPLDQYRRPAAIQHVAKPSVFGRDLYLAHSRSKIVVNGAIDMAGDERGNMRCWEAMGLGCLMISDTGIYPPGMVAGKSFLTYSDNLEISSLIVKVLDNWEKYHKIALSGYNVVSSTYSKSSQMKDFELLAGKFL